MSAEVVTKAIKVVVNEMQSDYAIGGLLGLTKWQCKSADKVSTNIHEIDKDKFQLIVTNDNTFCPCIFGMKQGQSHHMIVYLQDLLCLKKEKDTPPQEGMLSDKDIIEMTGEYHLPIFVVTGGSYQEGKAAASVTIVVPDV